MTNIPYEICEWNTIWNYGKLAIFLAIYLVFDKNTDIFTKALKKLLQVFLEALFKCIGCVT